MVVRFEPDDSSGPEDFSGPGLPAPISLSDFASRRANNDAHSGSVPALVPLNTSNVAMSELARQESSSGAVKSGGRPQLRRLEHPSPVSDDEQQSMSSADLEQKLIWALNRRAMSIHEASGYLKDLGAQEAETEDIVEKLKNYGYLNDAALAEQHLHRALRRKVQSVQAVRRELQRRGISEADIAQAIEQEPDDEYQRALEFAQKRAASLRSLESAVAERRLYGQLARRGFPSSLALEVTRAALSQ